MAEKKIGKKFVQKPKFRNEKKYKTDKQKLRNITLSGKKRQRKKLL